MVLESLDRPSMNTINLVVNIISLPTSAMNTGRLKNLPSDLSLDLLRREGDCSTVSD